VKKALKEEWAAGGGAPGRAITEGRAAVEELRRSFEFFWEGYPDVRASLLRLVRSARIAKDARDSGVGKEFFESASDIREGLTATGERSWSGNVEQVRTRLPVDLGRLPADLERAVGLVRADLEAQMEGFFTDSWTGQNGLKEPVAAAVAKPGEGGDLNFPPEFREFLKSLKELFGKELRGTLGKLRVTEGFKKFVREVETFETEKKALNVDGVEVTFVARQVPRAAQGFPYMVMEYSAKGEEPVRSLPFAAGGEASSLPITWKPSQAQSLKIFLLDDKKQNQKLFRSWAGSDCVPRAIVEAQTTGSLLKWESKVPELSGDSVGYEVQCAADGLERLIRFSKASEKPEVPDRVLETGSKE
jgi:hypothetical protein